MSQRTDPADYRATVAAIMARGVEWEIDPTLDRIRDLVDVLGEPHRAYPVIHIAGTNGKSSTARLIEALLRERGLRTGLYTSPELTTLRERIAIDGEPISEERFVETFNDVLPYVELVDGKHTGRLSFFEILTAMAYAAFADAPVDVAVVERHGRRLGRDERRGRRGRRDHPDRAGPHPLPRRHAGGDRRREGGDHQDRRGRGARAAAGRGGRGAAAPGRGDRRHGGARGHRVRRAEPGRRLRRPADQPPGLHGRYDEIFLPLFGEHQAGNAATALAAVEAFASGAPTGGGQPGGGDPHRG